MEINEQQAIQITIDHGYEGNEFNTAAWKKRGCLMPNRSLDGLIKKLETIYNHVKIEGKGKKRRYILKDKKDQATERKFNYKGRSETEEEKTMREYVFSQLLKVNNGKPNSFRKWGELIGLPDVSIIKAKEYGQVIKDSVADFKQSEPDFNYNSQEVVGKFINEIKIRNRSVISNSLSNLEKKNKIKVETVYIMDFINIGAIEVKKEQYEDTMQKLNKFLKEMNYSYFQYLQAVENVYKNNTDKRKIEKVQRFLKDEFHITMLYKLYKVKITDREEYRTVSKKKFNQAYVNRFVHLTKKRQQKESYATSLSFWQRFYLYNTLLMLDKLGYKFETLIYQEEKTRLEQLRQFYRENLENDYQRKVNNHAFGKLPDRYQKIEKVLNL